MARKPKSDSPKKPAPKFAIPRKGEKCERIERPENFFHKKSFRWVEVADKGKGKAFVMVGCPRFARGKSGAQRSSDKTRKDPKSETRWNPAAPLGMQCTYVKNGQKAGLVSHAVVQRRVGGNCRPGYGRK